jgi:hypothetical protein
VLPLRLYASAVNHLPQGDARALTRIDFRRIHKAIKTPCTAADDPSAMSCGAVTVMRWPPIASCRAIVVSAKPQRTIALHTSHVAAKGLRAIVDEVRVADIGSNQ